jgi:hypothetical protein
MYQSTERKVVENDTVQKQTERYEYTAVQQLDQPAYAQLYQQEQHLICSEWLPGWLLLLQLPDPFHIPSQI